MITVEQFEQMIDKSQIINNPGQMQATFERLLPNSGDFEEIAIERTINNLRTVFYANNGRLFENSEDAFMTLCPHVLDTLMPDAIELIGAGFLAVTSRRDEKLDYTNEGFRVSSLAKVNELVDASLRAHLFDIAGRLLEGTAFQSGFPMMPPMLLNKVWDVFLLGFLSVMGFCFISGALLGEEEHTQSVLDGILNATFDQE